MKNRIMLFLIFLLLVPLVFAEINLVADQAIYNLGDNVKVSLSAARNENFEGFLALSMQCSSYKKNYFLTPVSLEAGFMTSVNVPEIKANEQMIGSCRILAELQNSNNYLAEQKFSGDFTVTKDLKVLVVQKEIESLPGKEILISGVVNEAYGNNVVNADVLIKFDEVSEKAEAAGGKFEKTIQLANNIKSGNHRIAVEASEGKNSGTSFVDLKIIAVPTSLKAELASAKYDPGALLNFVPYLLDQAGDQINATVDIEFMASKGSKIFRKSAPSNQEFAYELGQYADPGIYNLVVKYQNLEAKNQINVSAVKDIKVTYGTQSVFVENIGNVIFNEELTFLIENELNKFAVTKKIKLDPGKYITLDLSKEVPSGIYDVLGPLKEEVKPVSDKIKVELSSIFDSSKANYNKLANKEKSLLANDVKIDDNRPIIKKIFSGLGNGVGSINSFLVGSDGVLTNHPLVGPSIIGIIVGGLFLKYGRKPIMRFLKRKKVEGKEKGEEKEPSE